VEATTERGVVAIHGDVHDISGEYDVVLFTRSLHHAENLDGILESTKAGTLHKTGDQSKYATAGQATARPIQRIGGA